MVLEANGAPADILVRLRDRSGDEFVAEPLTLTKTMGGQDITVDVYKGGLSRHCSASPT